MDNELSVRIDSLLDGYKVNDLKVRVNKIINDYHLDNKYEHHLISNLLDAKIYASYRMRATYKACYEALKNTFDLYQEDINSACDIGSGSGASIFALNEVKEVKDIYALEKNHYMDDVRSFLMDETILKDKVHPVSFDLTKETISPKVDLVLSSYVLNENNPNLIRELIIKMWEATNKVMLIIEPGTKEGSAIIKKVREIVLSLGGYIISPCPHQYECHNEWCHFSSRINRSKLQRLLKDGEMSYEDEKYSYIAFSKTKIDTNYIRLLRVIKIAKGYLDLEICDDSNNRIIRVTKSSPDYKKFKSLAVGEALQK